jgi:hypothetical protein
MRYEKKLDELTKKASEEIAKKPVNPEQGQEPISLEDVGLDAPNVRRRRERAVKTFSSGLRTSRRRNGVACTTQEAYGMGSRPLVLLRYATQSCVRQGFIL